MTHSVSRSRAVVGDVPIAMAGNCHIVGQLAPDAPRRVAMQVPGVCEEQPAR